MSEKGSTLEPTLTSGPAREGEPVRVEVVYAPLAGPVDLSQLVLPAGSTLAQAVAASGVLPRHGLGAEHAAAGIWGRRARQDTPLRDGDRVELYRPLVCDPKEARRLRHRGQRELRPGAAAQTGGQARGPAAGHADPQSESGGSPAKRVSRTRPR